MGVLLLAVAQLGFGRLIFLAQVRLRRFPTPIGGAIRSEIMVGRGGGV
jgi:hypothetical protein